MESQFKHLEAMNPEYGAVLVEKIILTAEQIHQAINISEQVIGESQQWNTYMNALAFFGFENWLSQNYPELVINSEDCSLFQPAVANIIRSVCNLKVNNFKLCILNNSSWSKVINLPRSAFDLPQFVSHFYVVITVFEEDHSVQVWGFVRYDKLKKQLYQFQLKSDSDWNYSLPQEGFERDMSQLLLELSCLETTAISLPNTITDNLCSLSCFQTELMQKLPQLQSPEVELQQIFTGEQAAILLTHPELLNCLYQFQKQEHNETQIQQFKQILQRLTQPSINFALWLRDELDEVAKSLSWVLLPPTALSGFRSSYQEQVYEAKSSFSFPEPLQNKDINTIFVLQKFLQEVGVWVPSEARTSYKDFELAKNSLRLYAVTWLSEPASTPDNWTLLLILGQRIGNKLPDKIKLCIYDEQQMLDEQVQGDNLTHLYSEIVGQGNEKILVEVSLESGETFIFPLLTYHGMK
jgi:hypothetical protein